MEDSFWLFPVSLRLIKYLPTGSSHNTLGTVSCFSWWCLERSLLRNFPLMMGREGYIILSWIPQMHPLAAAALGQSRRLFQVVALLCPRTTAACGFRWFQTTTTSLFRDWASHDDLTAFPFLDLIEDRTHACGNKQRAKPRSLELGPLSLLLGVILYIHQISKIVGMHCSLNIVRLFWHSCARCRCSLAFFYISLSPPVRL